MAGAATSWYRDRYLLSLLAAGALLNGAVWLYLALRMQSLPDVLPIHYSSSGQVDRIGFRQQLLILPIIGLLALLGNSVLSLALYERERQLGYVLQAVAIPIQLLLLGAALSLIH